MYTLAVNAKGLSKGTPINIDGLGLFENGKKYEISEEAEEAYRMRHSVQRVEYDDEGNMFVEVELGPSLTDVESDLFKVTKSLAQQESDDKTPKGDED